MIIVEQALFVVLMVKGLIALLAKPLTYFRASSTEVQLAQMVGLEMELEF
jgi:hypothetical protein